MTATDMIDPVSSASPSEQHLTRRAESKLSSRSSSSRGYRSHNMTPRTFSDRASIILIGVRSAGKRSLGFIASTHLGRQFITEGYFFQEFTGMSKAEYLDRYGQADYYRCCRDVFKQMLLENSEDCVIECGMASLDKEAQQLLHQFCKTNPVVYVARDFGQVSSLLKLSEGDTKRLKQWDISHRNFSNYEFYNLYDSTGNIANEDVVLESHPASSLILREVKIEFSQFVESIMGNASQNSAYSSPFALDATPLEKRKRTFAACVMLTDLLNNEIGLEHIDKGEDAVRLRIDTADFETISKSVAAIRRTVGVPLIYDLSESLIKSLTEHTQHYAQLLEHGLRLAVDYMIVDIDCDPHVIRKVHSCKGRTKLIGRCYEVVDSPRQWLTDERLDRARFAQSLGFDHLEICQNAISRQDNEDISVFRNHVLNVLGHSTLLTLYNVGPLGLSSFLSNSILTPVRCEIFAPKSLVFPPLTATQITKIHFHSFQLDGLSFSVVGNYGAHSLSPAMHNAAYRYLGLDHQYGSRDVSRFEDLKGLLEDSYFGGCSVNTPYKVTVFNQLTYKSSYAEAIGAVNTLLPLRKSFDGAVSTLADQAAQRNEAGPVAGFYGENTDWIGFVISFRQRLSPRNTINPHSTGLVLGAGGAARAAVFAMLQLGCQNIFICNRNAEKATTIAGHFNRWTRANRSANKDYVHVIRDRNTPWPANFQPPTMLISCIPGMTLGSAVPNGYRVRSDWLASSSGGVVADVSYKPAETQLLTQAQEISVETGCRWVTVTGLELLPEQAAVQFELMTGRRAPRKLMREEAIRNYGRTSPSD